MATQKQTSRPHPDKNAAQTAMDLDHQALLDLFLRSLSQPTARPGLRLRSERELAVALGVSRARVAWVIGKLSQQGIVARKTGSGTFLRSVTSVSARGETIAAERLFSSTAPPPPMAHAAAMTTRHGSALHAPLKIGVGWMQMSSLTHTNRLTVDAMSARAQELGHTLTYHNFGMPGISGLEHSIQMLSRHRFDGLLLCAIGYVPMRINTAARDIGQTPPPFAYFYTASIDPLAKLEMTPAVTLDDAGAAYQAVALLAAQGYEKIAMISLHAPRVTAVYDSTLRELGLTYRCTRELERATPDSPAPSEAGIIRLGRQMAADLLDGPNPPDAIYVADDILMLGVAELLEERGLAPGGHGGSRKRPGIISMANMGGPLPPSPGQAVSPWSVLMMDPARLGKLAVDLMVEVIQNPESRPADMQLTPRWCPGISHVGDGMRG